MVTTVRCDHFNSDETGFGADGDTIDAAWRQAAQMMCTCGVKFVLRSDISFQISRATHKPMRPLRKARRNCSSGDTAYALGITHYTGTRPRERIVALVPVDAASVSAFSRSSSARSAGVSTHKVLRPAMRGCVAQDPPSTTLCFPSKKSATVCQSGSLSRERKSGH